MTTKTGRAKVLTAAQMDELGYGPLLPIVPPDGKIWPHSKLKQKDRGKVPGKWTGVWWIGYPWRDVLIRPADIDRYGGNIGLLLGEFIAIDVDVKDAALSERMQEIIVKYFDKPPVKRVGEAPKCAFLCRRAGAEMGRLQIHFNLADTPQLIELLAQGQQIVVQGPHARTLKPYTYPNGLPPASELPTLDYEKVSAMFAEIREALKVMGIETSLTGPGKITQRDEVDQESLLGPIDAIREAVAHIPNTDKDHPTRASWIEMGIAIKAATARDPKAGLEIYMEWSLLWPDNDEAKVIAAWDSFNNNAQIGADWLYAKARKYGHAMAHLDFDPLEGEPPPLVPPEPSPKEPRKNEAVFSHVWLTERFIDNYGERFRWVYDRRLWYVFRENEWVSGANVLRPYVVRYCTDVSNYRHEQGTTDQQIREAHAEAKAISSRGTIDAVARLCEDMPRVQARVDDFDGDPDLIGVPGGYVDLRTGELHPPDRDRMISLRTTIQPEHIPAPRWEKFLYDATGGNLRMISYLKRTAGYALTGRTEEHVFFLIWGGGGNGKSTFLNALANILGEYCRTAQMDAFTAVQQPAHPAAVAALAGARMVQSQETRPGQKWDETLLKQLTGGDAVTARFMYGNPFTYIPTYKLFFSGNHQPHLSSVGEAMKRRIHIIPFPFKPPVPNKLLGEQLRAEYPAILAWAIEGAQEWYTMGLCPPEEVMEATRDYLEGEDEMGRWITEHCRLGETLQGKAGALYDDWSTWCLSQGAYQVSQTVFAKKLQERGHRQRRSAATNLFEGIDLKEEYANPE